MYGGGTVDLLSIVVKLSVIPIIITYASLIIEIIKMKIMPINTAKTTPAKYLFWRWED